MKKITNNKPCRFLAVLMTLVLVLSILPMGAQAAGYTVDHIDIALNLTATVNIDGVDQQVEFKLTTADKDNVTITNGSGQTMSVTKLTTGSTDTAGNPQIRFEGSFPVGTQSDPVYYTVVLKKTLEITTAAGKTVQVPVTLTATMHYWDSGNVCPGWSRNPGRQSGIDLILGNGSGSYQSPTGTLQLQKTVSGAALAEDTTFYFDIYKDGATYQEDVPVVVEAGGTIGMQMLLNVPLGTYTVVEDTSRAVVAEYILTDTSYSTEGGQVVINESTGYNGIVNVTNTYEEVIVTRELTVTKAWVNDTPSLRPESILVQLYRDGTPEGDPVELNDSNGWTYVWTGLDDRYVWTVDEINVPAGYIKNVTEENGVVVITNTHTDNRIGNAHVSVTKIWDDNGYPDRPDSVTVQLLCGGEAHGDPVVLNAENNWHYTWYELNEDLAWTVAEIDVPEGYTSTVAQDGFYFTVTNSMDYEPPTDPTDPPTDPTDPPTDPTDPPTDPTDPPTEATSPSTDPTPTDTPAVVNVPRTGGTLTAWIMVSSISGICLAGMLMTRKKENES